MFTSIRSPMGQGYRLIAASGRVKPEEKVDILRCSPSHASLCDESPDALGLLCYPLKTGRYCIGCCLHAGVEHTARGGLRVYTHMVIVEPQVLADLDGDVVRIHAALRGHLCREGPMLGVPPCPTRLKLSIPKPAPAGQSVNDDDADSTEANAEKKEDTGPNKSLAPNPYGTGFQPVGFQGCGIGSRDHATSAEDQPSITGDKLSEDPEPLLSLACRVAADLIADRR
ncbi:MAG TPA: hypothetical protein VLM89_13630, partial [Phycisphaerae bacterium]|nr:hypothetical protein [Phycisphaerae bacterium]